MPTIGGVFIPDDIMPTIGAGPAPARPGLLSVLGAAAQGAYGQVRYGLPYQIEKLAGTADQNDERFYQQGLAEAAAAANKAAPASVGDLTSGRVGFGSFVGENLAASLPYMVGSVVGAIGGGLAGSAIAPGAGTAAGAIAGAVAGGIPQFSGSNVARAVEQEGGLSQDAAERSLLVAPFQSAADAAIGRFLPGAGHVLGDLAAGQAGGFIRRTATSVLKAGGTEAITEAAQQVGERYAAGMELGDADAAGEYVNAAVTAFALGGVLGAGGGFRRMNADAKLPQNVTNEDIDAKIGSILALPSPEMLGRSAQGPEVGVPYGQPVTPVDAAGRIGAPGGDPVALANAPRAAAPPLELGEIAPELDLADTANTFAGNVTPQVQAVLNQGMPPVAAGPSGLSFDPANPQLPQGDVSAAALGNTPVGQTPEVTPPASRRFAGETLEDLNSALRIQGEAPQAIAVREEAARELSSRYAEAAGAAPLTAPDFQTRLDEVKAGLRGGWVSSLTATDPADLIAKVNARLGEDTSVNVRRLGERLGLVDAEGNATPQAAAVEAAETAALQAETQAPAPASLAPVTPEPAIADVPASPVERTPTSESSSAIPDPTYAQYKNGDIKYNDMSAQAKEQVEAERREENFQQLLENEPGLTREQFEQRRVGGMNMFRSMMGLPPADTAPTTAPVRVEAAAQAPTAIQSPEANAMAALVNDKVAARGQNASKIEKEAKRLGLITDNDSMDITPKGRAAFLQTADAPAAIAAAAEQQGLDAAGTAQFDRGARAQVTGEAEPQFASTQDRVNYDLGKLWAEDFVANGETLTADQTRAVQARQTARETLEGTPTTRAGERNQLSPAQLQQRSASGLVAASDLTGVSEGDVATLIRAARTGNPAQVGEMIEHVQRGGTLFTQPETGEVTMTTQTDGRGQPIFREMNTPERGAGRAANAAETEKAVKAKKDALRAEIDAAYNSADITPVQRLKLAARLRNNDFRGVIDRLPGGPLENQLNASRHLTLGNIAQQAANDLDDTHAVVGAFKGQKPVSQAAVYASQGNVQAVLRTLAETSSNPQYRALANRLLNSGGWDNVTLETAPANGDIHGTTRLNEDGSTRVRLYGEDGVTEETMLHELTHAFVQQRWAGLGAYTEDNRAIVGDGVDRANGAITEFQELWRDIGNAMYSKHPDLINNEAWASNFYDSPDEALSWAMTNPQAQAWLKQFDENGNPAAEGKSLWTKMVDWVRKVLGLPDTPAARTMLDRVLDAGNAIVDQGKDVRTGEYSTAFAQAWAAQGDALSMDRNVGPPAHAQEANTVATRISEAAGDFVARLNPQNVKASARRYTMGILSHAQMGRSWGQQVPAIFDHEEAHRARKTQSTRWEAMFDATHQKYEALLRAQPKVAEKLSQVMATSTELGLDYDKTWDEHTWLDEDPVEKARLKPAYDKMMVLVNDLKRGAGDGKVVLDEFRNLNEAQNFGRMAVDLYSHVATDPELRLGVANSWANPADQFLAEAGTLTDPAEIRAWWDAALATQTQNAADFVRRKNGEAAAGTLSDQRAMKQHLTPVEERINSIYEARIQQAKAPYFHLGRFGDNFGSATIKVGADGKVDPVAQAAVAKAMEEGGFNNVQISADNSKPKIMMRFEKVDQASRFGALSQQLEAAGHIEKDSTKYGPRNLETFGTAGQMPAYVSSYIQNIENSPMFAYEEGMSDKDRASLFASKEKMKQIAIDTWVASQPDSAISKVLTKRYTVAGYDKDMIRNFAHRWRVGSGNIASAATAPKFDAAFMSMKAQYNEALSASSPNDPYVAQDVLNELKTRDAQNPVNELADAFDKLRGYTHSYFLGFSPAYGMINMTQLGVTALPEMAKSHGYVKAFHAMRRNTPKVLAIMKAVASEATKLGWRNAGDIAITDTVLRKAGLSEADRGFIHQMMATGTIDIGSMARSLGQVADAKSANGNLETYLRMSSAIGLYTETSSRLLTALSARELHGSYDKAAQDYATKTVSESMFEYQSWNTARQLGKKGFLGPVTPIVTQFMSYQAQLTEKLYSEARDAFSKARPGESAESAKARRAGAQRFLAGHLTAVTTLAGTLGLPFAAAFAFALEKMVDAVDDDETPFDATAAWRGFLADTLGKDVGEVVARGAPRALGFDISSRAGEQNLLPGTDLLTDKRSWKEALANSSSRSIGAAPSMLVNVLDGGGQMANGDVIGGMKTMLPIAFKGPTEVYRMTTEGYVDTKGNKLPMTPGSSAILWQLLGFSPAQKAEYSEARMDQAARRGEIARRAGALRQGITRSLMNGDREGARELISDAIQFDQDNPEFAVIPSIGSSISKQTTGAALARATTTPVGVSLSDVAGQQLTRYANF